MKLLSAVIALFVSWMMAVSAAQTPGSIWSGISNEAQIARGAQVFTDHCASCHGMDLRGNSNTPSLLGMSFMFLWEGRTLGELFTQVRSQMPSNQPGSLSAQNYIDVIAFILRTNEFPVGTAELVPELQVLEAIAITPRE